jgi:hypothetical protein
MGNRDQVAKVDKIIDILTSNRPEVLRNTYDTEALKTCTFIPFFDRVKPKEQEQSFKAADLRKFEDKLKLIDNYQDNSKAVSSQDSTGDFKSLSQQRNLDFVNISASDMGLNSLKTVYGQRFIENKV